MAGDAERPAHLAGDKRSTKDASIPFRLFDCFLLVTPDISEAFETFLRAESGVAADLFACLTSAGAAVGVLDTSAGDGTVAVWAMCSE